MKISKRQLRRIIKEEKAKLVKENKNDPYRHPGTGENLWFSINDAVNMLMDNGIDFNEIATELRGIADDVEDSINQSPGR